MRFAQKDHFSYADELERPRDWAMKFLERYAATLSSRQDTFQTLENGTRVKDEGF